MSPGLDYILTDEKSGSSQIITATLGLLKKTPPEERFSLCERIIDAHPSMAGLRCILDSLTEETPLAHLTDAFKKMNDATSRHLETLTEDKTVTAISRSHTVEHGLLRAEMIIVLESAPGREGLETASWLREQGKKVKIYDDASVARAVKESDMVAVGADALLSTGFINKRGTIPLALTARHFHKPLYVAAPSYKFLDEMPVIGPLFEFVPRKLATAVIDEKGGQEVPFG